LSGVLNTLLVLALWLEWLSTRSRIVIAVFVACLAKVLIEVALDSSVLTRISWPPFPWSHVAGMSAGLLLIGIRSAVPALLKPRFRSRHSSQLITARDVSTTKTA
jgi:hypothetical protein